MSLKRLAVISAVGSHNSFSNQTISYISSYSGSASVEQGSSGYAGSGNLRTGGHHQGLQTMRPGANLHGNVNIMLGGAMLSVVITVVCFVCYCCHRNIKKRSNSIYRQQWLETEANMEIYSVEQCYDPPPAGSGGFFMDNGGTGDYQPMITSAINHAGHHPPYPYSYHQHYHQQQQQQQQQLQQHPHYQYTPYPNGPPPSYDTVVAQDELLASVSRRKRNLPEDIHPPTAGPSCSSAHSCLDSPDCDKPDSPCTEAPLLPKTPPLARSCSGGRRRIATDWQDDPRDGECSRESRPAPTSCSCTTELTISHDDQPPPPPPPGLPIYCRNCGYFVEGSRDSPIVPPPSVDQIGQPHNEALLVDYEEPSTGELEQDGPHESDVNRNNVIDDSGNRVTTTATGDIDVLTMRPRMASSSPGPMDAMNNNAANETSDWSDGFAATSEDARLHGNRSLTGVPVAKDETTIVVMEHGENNNVITDALPGRTTTDGRLISPMEHREGSGDIIRQCPGNTSTKMTPNQDGETNAIDQRSGQTLEDHTNGNSTGEAILHVENPSMVPSNPDCSDTGARSLLNENGLVRLDMSQIIDNTGLPTYEAALKLESSGYV
ncbi:uncharacterized protein LOC128724695 [Anopheles nili]|uniref:uncharacterized protein LOC128724695 n=1 Tax=Anopheles nili TaxID=185578 RepID=UPI00237C0D7A|nr:uncharacterized protein LOC128724695 [Anopheles nili]